MLLVLTGCDSFHEALSVFDSGILERGMVVKEYARDIDEKLRLAEMESIQVRQYQDGLLCKDDAMRTA